MVKDEIKKAIGAHGLWKARLQSTIESGVTEIPVETIKVDNQCAFGKWLYENAGKIDGDQQEIYQRVTELHAQFHEVAGKVAAFAVAGNHAAAKQMLEKEYALASSKLTMEMMKWQQKL